MGSFPAAQDGSKLWFLLWTLSVHLTWNLYITKHWGEAPWSSCSLARGTPMSMSRVAYYIRVCLGPHWIFLTAWALCLLTHYIKPRWPPHTGPWFSPGHEGVFLNTPSLPFLQHSDSVFFWNLRPLEMLAPSAELFFKFYSSAVNWGSWSLFCSMCLKIWHLNLP